MTDINDPTNSPAAGSGSTAPGSEAPGWGTPVSGTAVSGSPALGTEGVAPSYPASPGGPPPTHPEPPAAASVPGAEKPVEPRRDPTGEAEARAQEEKKLREPFPFLRLLAAVLYGFLASLVFWVALLLAALQFITIAISGEKNDELDRFNRRIARYMQEMFDYIMLSSDKQPFPFGPFPPE